jgi:integrase/recombinase XerD
VLPYFSIAVQSYFTRGKLARESHHHPATEGKAERTQANYIRQVRILTEHLNKTPDLIIEEELQEYFLYRRNVSKWAPPSTMKSCYAGIRFFFKNVLKRDWHIFKIIWAKTEYRMPTVLTIEEAHNILAHVTSTRNRAFLATVYSCGLRPTHRVE